MGLCLEQHFCQVDLGQTLLKEDGTTNSDTVHKTRVCLNRNSAKHNCCVSGDCGPIDRALTTDTSGRSIYCKTLTKAT